jgi:hypothetical protein
MKKIQFHHVSASQRYKSYLTLVISKEQLLIDFLGDQSTILLHCFKILVCDYIPINKPVIPHTKDSVEKVKVFGKSTFHSNHHKIDCLETL